jgi:hypothetical protein
MSICTYACKDCKWRLESISDCEIEEVVGSGSEDGDMDVLRIWFWFKAQVQMRSVDQELTFKVRAVREAGVLVAPGEAILKTKASLVSRHMMYYVLRFVCLCGT